MARIRTVKPEFFTSEDIVSLTPLARVFYIALWCEADREGRLSWKPRTLKMRYLPGDDCDVETVAQELIDGGQIAIYEVDGSIYAEIPSFKKHQVINNRESDSSLPARVAHASARVKAEGRKEGKGKEGKEGASGEAKASPSSSDKTLRTFLSECKADDVKPVPDDHFIRKYMATAGISDEMAQVAWIRFRDDHLTGTRKAKKYKDWAGAFANSVKDRWYRLWICQAEGDAQWTSEGVQARRVIESAVENEEKVGA